uniref:Myosin motor domain-containing protein n=1 Tax=Globisporangium ultimum (strain ATCC 200006 / CBS 805.95 / DAOM BR144) TaxID=431595 RepID=K3WU75_GLOUD
MEKVQQLFLRMQSQALSRALQKWIAFRMYEKNKLKANMFLKCKGSQKMAEIMNKWRRKVTRRKFGKWKTECLIDARNEFHCAAIELQRTVRGKLARLELIRLRRKAAAILIQSLVRGHLGRCLVKRIRRTKLEYESAYLLQRCYRGYNGKRVGRALFEAQREGLAARKIQRAFRNHQRREILHVIQQTKLEHDCAIKLQCCIRSHLARRERSRRAHEKKRTQSSIVIQRHARGLLARRRALELRRQHAAAVKIQCKYRAYRSQFQVLLMRKEKELCAKNAHARMTATKIQARWRCFHSRKLYLKEQVERIEAQRLEALLRLTNAMKIQSAYRGYKARRVAQRARYEKLKWMNFTIMNRSALKIQSFWRGYHGRLASHLRLQAKSALEYEENEAAKRIQLIAKGKIARAEKQKRLQQREQMNLLHQNRTKAALKIQKVYRGKRARKIVIKLHEEHQQEARRALERLQGKKKHNEGGSLRTYD